MGEEIEIYILKKLEDAIRDSKASSEFHFAARLFLPKLHKDFIDLKDLIEKKRAKIKSAAARPHPTPAANVARSPDVSKPSAPGKKLDEKDTGASLDAGGDKDSATPLDDNKDTTASLNAGGDVDKGAPPDATSDEKETGAQDAADGKEPASGAGDRKETGAQDAADDKEPASGAGDRKETGAPSDAAVKKETDAPLDAPDVVAGDKKHIDAPSDATDQHESDTHESDVGTSAESTTQDETEISPASTGDGERESNASKPATLAKTSTDEPEISPVTDDDATDHKSKTPPTSAGGGKKESAVKSSTDANTKSGSNTVVPKPINEEDLLREQLYYLNNVLTEWQTITKKPFSYSSDSLSSMKDLSKTLKKIKQDLTPTKKTEESSHSGIPPTASSDNASLIRTTPEVGEYRWSTRLVNLDKVHGFEDKILSLERLLVLRRKDTDAFKAFGIHGMAGVGKTTLCQSIFSRPRVSGYFFPRIWVCLSKQKGEDEDNKKEVVKRMLRCLGIDDKIINKVDEKQGIRGLLFALRLQLTGKRYFIVLDDAHNADEWFKMPDSDTENDNNKIYEKFSYGLPKECGGTVLVTSRVEQVVKNMVGDEENLRCIEPLTDEDTCWTIFKDTVEEDGTQFPEDLKKLKKEIVKRCDGLPLAAKLLGQIKHKELRENPTLAGNQRAAGQVGNQQAAIQEAAVQAAK